MRLDHSQVVLGFDGEPVLNPPDKSGVEAPVTFRQLVTMALSNIEPTDGAEMKARIYATLQKFYRGKHAKLTVEERALVKERAGGTLSPLAFGRLSEWLEGEPQFVGSDEEDGDEDGDGGAATGGGT